MSKAGLASLAQGRSDIFQIDPRQLHIKSDWNSRDMNAVENKEHVEQLTASIVEIGVKEPLTVYWEDGKAWVTNGHCRLLAALAAQKINPSLKTIPVKSEERYGNEADRIFAQVIRNSGKPFTLLEQAKVFKKLLDLGWSQQDIAKKAGYSAGRVSQILNFNTIPAPVQAWVNEGKVSTSLAMQVVQAAPSGTDAEKHLRAGIEAAAAEGAPRVTPGHLAGVAPEAMGSRVNIKTAVKDAFECSDVDDSDSEMVVIKMPVEKWEIIRKLCEL